MRCRRRRHETEHAKTHRGRPGIGWVISPHSGSRTPGPPVGEEPQGWVGRWPGMGVPR
jgi:hypothetical protein